MYRYIRYTVYDIRYTTFSYIVYITLVDVSYSGRYPKFIHGLNYNTGHYSNDPGVCVINKLGRPNPRAWPNSQWSGCAKSGARPNLGRALKILFYQS